MYSKYPPSPKERHLIDVWQIVRRDETMKAEYWDLMIGLGNRFMALEIIEGRHPELTIPKREHS